MPEPPKAIAAVSAARPESEEKTAATPSCRRRAPSSSRLLLAALGQATVEPARGDAVLVVGTGRVGLEDEFDAHDLAPRLRRCRGGAAP